MAVTLESSNPMLFAPARCDGFYTIRDEASRLVAFLVLDSLTSGTTFGGIRRIAYPSERDAALDAQRLARSMTLKARFAGLGVGGAKCVMMDHAGLDRAAAYRALGEAIERLAGNYHCGPDVGTTDDDLAEVRKTTRYVHGCGADPGRSTARGVLACLQACFEFSGRRKGFDGASILVQGLGSVGWPLFEGLLEKGAKPAVSDIRRERTEEAKVVAESRGANIEIVAPEACDSWSGDVWAPCAVGPVINPGNVGRVRVAVICGSANAQLAGDDMADELRRRGILYAPDFVANAGAIIEGVMTRAGESACAAKERIGAAIDAMGPRLLVLLREAERRSTTPLALALEKH